MKKINTFHRYFNDYSEIDDFQDIPYMDSLAVVVQEFLYKKEYNEWSYNTEHQLYGIIKIYDFMSLAVCLIEASLHKLGEAAIKGFIDDLKQLKPEWGFRFENIDEEDLHKHLRKYCDVIEYENDEHDIVIYNGNSLEWPLLWTTYVYASARFLIDKSDCFKKTADMLFRLIQGDEPPKRIVQNKGSFRLESERVFPPIKWAKEATEMLCNLIQNKLCKTDMPQTQHMENTKESLEQEEYANDITSQNARIKELETKVKELEEELAAYKERNQNRAGINCLQTAHLGLKLAPKLGINVSNKKELAPALSKLFGWGKRSLEQQMSKVLSEDEEMELANIFSDLSPDLAKEICKKWEGTPNEESEAPQTE